MVARWERGLGGWGRRGERDSDGQIGSYMNSHRDVEYSAGNIVSNDVITLYGASWALDLLGDHFVSYINV